MEKMEKMEGKEEKRRGEIEEILLSATYYSITNSRSPFSVVEMVGGSAHSPVI